MYRAIQFLLTVVVLFGMSAVAQASYIPMLQDTTSGAVIFDANFEDGTVGGALSTTTPAFGTLSMLDWTGLADTQIADASPTAYAGAKYLKFSTYDNHTPWTGGFGVAANSGNGDAIKWTFGFDLLTEGKLSGQTPTGNKWWIYCDDSAGNHLVNTSLSVAGGLSADTWHTFVVTHTNGTASFSVTADGSPFATLAATSMANWTGFTIGPDGGGNVSMGAAFDGPGIPAPSPEPSALVLLTTALIGLLAYAWRKRR